MDHRGSYSSGSNNTHKDYADEESEQHEFLKDEKWKHLFRRNSEGELDTTLDVSAMEVSEHVGSLLTKIENDNKERQYKRRESALFLLNTNDPIIITIYQTTSTGKFGFSLRGGGKASMVEQGQSNSRGQYVRSVDIDSPADQAGLKAGDRIIAVNEVPCEGQCHEVVRDLVLKSDTPLKLLILRDETLGEKAKETTSKMMQHEFQEVINEETGNPTLTAEMKGTRLGRTRKFVEKIARGSIVEEDEEGEELVRKQSKHSHPLSQQSSYNTSSNSVEAQTSSPSLDESTTDYGFG